MDSLNLNYPDRICFANRADPYQKVKEDMIGYMIGEVQRQGLQLAKGKVR